MDEPRTDLPLRAGSAFVANDRNKADGIELLAALHDKSIAAAFFDPQNRRVLDKLAYGNEGKQRGQRRSGLPQMHEDDIKRFIAEIARVLRESGHLFLWVDKFHLCEGVLPWCEGTELELVDMLVWDKLRIGMGYRTRRKAEYLVIFQRRPKRARGVWLDHTIADIWPEKVDARAHPHAKPIDLQTRLLEAVTLPGDWALDPAAGSYSLLEACRRSGRNFIGGDING